MPFIPNVNLTSIKRLFGAVEQPGSFLVADQIVPTYDVGNVGLSERREWTFGSNNVSSPNGFVSKQVPAGEFWIVHMFQGATDTLDSDQAIKLQLAIRGRGAVGTLPSPVTRIGQPVEATGSAAPSELTGVGQTFQPPLILDTGTDFGVVVNRLTVGAAGAISVSLAVQITRIRT